MIMKTKKEVLDNYEKLETCMDHRFYEQFKNYEKVKE